MFTHGGWIVSFLKDKGVDYMPSNCSVIGVSCSDKERNVAFVWDYPEKSEDI